MLSRFAKRASAAQPTSEQPRPEASQSPAQKPQSITWIANLHFTRVVRGCLYKASLTFAIAKQPDSAFPSDCHSRIAKPSHHAFPRTDNTFSIGNRPIPVWIIQELLTLFFRCETNRLTTMFRRVFRCPSANSPVYLPIMVTPFTISTLNLVFLCADLLYL